MAMPLPKKVPRSSRSCPGSIHKLLRLFFAPRNREPGPTIGFGWNTRLVNQSVWPIFEEPPKQESASLRLILTKLPMCEEDAHHGRRQPHDTGMGSPECYGAIPHIVHARRPRSLNTRVSPDRSRWALPERAKPADVNSPTEPTAVTSW